MKRASFEHKTNFIFTSFEHGNKRCSTKFLTQIHNPLRAKKGGGREMKKHRNGFGFRQRYILFHNLVNTNQNSRGKDPRLAANSRVANSNWISKSEFCFRNFSNFANWISRLRESNSGMFPTVTISTGSPMATSSPKSIFWPRTSPSPAPPGTTSPTTNAAETPRKGWSAHKSQSRSRSTPKISKRIPSYSSKTAGSPPMAPDRRFNSSWIFD